MERLPSMRTADTKDPRFTYDIEANMDIREVGEEIFDGIAVHDIDVLGATGRRVSSYLVTPVKGAALPGVVLVHPLPGNRKSFLNEALNLVERRICSITVDAPWSGGMEWAKKIGDPVNDRKEFIGAIKDLRRSFDVLTSLSKIDPDRLGYVGHSLGALCGAVLSGIDRRAKAYVLMSGTSSFSEVATVNVPSLDEAKIARYRQIMSDIDPVQFVSHASPARIMFQMGKTEEYFGLRNRQALAVAASEPKDVRWYDAGHMLNEQARQDRDRWLEQELFR